MPTWSVGYSDPLHTTGDLLTDAFEIHFLESRKLREQAAGLEKRLVRRMLFLAASTRERMEEMAKEDAMMQKALTTLEFLRQDEQTRMLYEARQKVLHDCVSAIGEAEDKGRMEGQMESARAMLAEGMDTERTPRLTGLSAEEGEQLREERVN